MSKGRDRTVFKRPDGKWSNKRNDPDRASARISPYSRSPRGEMIVL